MLFSARKSREEQENPRKVQLFSNLFIRDHGCAPIEELRDSNLEFRQLLWLPGSVEIITRLQRAKKSYPPVVETNAIRGFSHFSSVLKNPQVLNI